MGRKRKQVVEAPPILAPPPVTETGEDVVAARKKQLMRMKSNRGFSSTKATMMTPSSQLGQAGALGS